MIEHFSKKVYQYDLNNKLIREYQSLSDAFIKTGIKNIAAVCRGNRKYSEGYIWKYRKDK